MLIVGDKEAESGRVSVRQRGKGDRGAQEVEALLAEMKGLSETRAAAS